MLILFTGGQVLLFEHKADISIWFLVLLGLPNSLTWTGIWPLALNGLGRFTKVGASLLIMGLSGNAILPSVYGYFADRIGVHDAYWVLLPCYLYLIYYAFYGHKVKRWQL
jgi:fucose permease